MKHFACHSSIQTLKSPPHLPDSSTLPHIIAHHYHCLSSIHDPHSPYQPSNFSLRFKISLTGTSVSFILVHDYLNICFHVSDIKLVFHAKWMCYLDNQSGHFRQQNWFCWIANQLFKLYQCKHFSGYIFPDNSVILTRSKTEMGPCDSLCHCWVWKMCVFWLCHWIFHRFVTQCLKHASREVMIPCRFFSRFLSKLTIVRLQKRYDGRSIAQIGCLLTHRATCSFGNSGVRWNCIANFGLCFNFTLDSLLFFCTTPSPYSVLLVVVLQACAFYDNWWPLLSFLTIVAALMYVILLMPLLFFVGSNNSSLVSNEGDRLVLCSCLARQHFVCWIH